MANPTFDVYLHKHLKHGHQATDIEGLEITYLSLKGGTLSGKLILRGGLQVVTGAVEGYVLTSDAFGNALWQEPPSGPGGGAPTSAPYVTIGNSASLTAERVLTGTVNQVAITDNGANNTVVLSLPQNINSAASPTFFSANLSSSSFALQSGGVVGVLGWAPTGSNKTITFPNISGQVFLWNGGQTISSGVWQGTPIDSTYIGAHAGSHKSGGFDPIRLDELDSPIASVNFNGQQATAFVVENRTNDPSSPVTGQLWIRTDL